MREILSLGIPEVRRMNDGRWQATLDGLGLVAVSSTEREARDSLKALIPPKLESLSDEAQIEFLAALPRRYTDDACSADGPGLGVIYDADGNLYEPPAKQHLRGI
jgi:hypothetical protein